MPDVVLAAFFFEENVNAFAHINGTKAFDLLEFASNRTFFAGPNRPTVDCDSDEMKMFAESTNGPRFGMGWCIGCFVAAQFVWGPSQYECLPNCVFDES